jgi:hypothetical protein
MVFRELGLQGCQDIPLNVRVIKLRRERSEILKPMLSKASFLDVA